MKDIHKTIGFIGAGTMGEAMIGALISSGTCGASSITACDTNSERLETLKRAYAIHITEDSTSLFTRSDVVILAVKPHIVGNVLQQIAGAKDYWIVQRKLVISIAAGITISKLEKFLYDPIDSTARRQLPIIRAMPNTPSLVMAGMSGMSPNPYATADDLNIARSILTAMGNVIEFKEADLDAVTAMSGSGPAYVFYYIESMIAAGAQVGLSAENASELAITTIKGAVKLLEEKGDSPQHLRHLVTTPGGTTEAAIKVLETRHFQQTIVEAIAAAAEKSRELGAR